MAAYVKDVLFVCRQNTARSQMAEALLNHMAPERFHAESAGLEAGDAVNPLAVEVLREVGLDISRNRTKGVFDLFLLDKTYNFVVTVCDQTSAERCPIFPGKSRRLHWNFPDPSSFTGSHEEKLAKTREVRDAIRKQLSEFIKEF